MTLREISSAEQIGFPILSLLILLPLLAAAALRVLRDERTALGIALAGAGLELALSALLAVRFIPEVADVQFVERGPSLPFIGASYHLGVDGVSVLFVPVTALLTLLVVAYAEYSVRAQARHYLAATLILEATLIGAFVSLDLLLFWIFFVAELVPSYALITRWGTGPGRQEAARDYVRAMLVGSALMLVGMVLLARNHADLGPGGAWSFDLVELLRTPVPPELQTFIFFLLFFGFAIKAPVFPFHTWLPKVLEQGPIVGMSVFLIGVKLGTYGFIRFIIPLLPEASREWYWLMAAFGAAGILYGSLIALVQSNLRRVLAFGSLSHMGAVIIGIFSLNFHGLQGGLLQMINLGVTGAGLFFVAGFIAARIGAPELRVLGGLAPTVPLLTTTFLVIALAGIGLPGTNGFNGEHLIMLGAYEAHWAMALMSGLGVFLTAAYLIRYFQRAFLGDTLAPSAATMPDLRPRELLIAATLGVFIFWVGLFTTPFLHAMNGSLRAIEERVERGSFRGTGAADAPGVHRFADAPELLRFEVRP